MCGGPGVRFSLLPSNNHQKDRKPQVYRLRKAKEAVSGGFAKGLRIKRRSLVAMYALIKAVPNTNAFGVMQDHNLPAGGEVGLCLIKGNTDFSTPVSVIKSPQGFFGFKTPDDLGTAIAKFFRETNKGIDAIAATEQIELVNIPLFQFLPYHTEWLTDPPMIYTRLTVNDYTAVVSSMTKELEK